MEDVLKERRNQLEATHQADIDRLTDEHNKNVKNLALKFQDAVWIIFFCFTLFVGSVTTRYQLL